MGKSKDGNVTCFMYTQMRIVGLVLPRAALCRGTIPLPGPDRVARVCRPQQSSLPLITVDDPPVERQLSLEMSI